MSRLAGPSCRSILYCRPEQPPPTTATRSTPVGRPCFANSELTFCAALVVNLTRRSSPVRKVGAPLGLFKVLAIITEGTTYSAAHRESMRGLQQPLRLLL